NLLTMEYEIDGKTTKELCPDGVGDDLSILLDKYFNIYFTSSLDRVYPLIAEVATKFNPVRDYLRSLPLFSPDYIDEFIEKSLGIKEPIHVLMARKWMIGTAIRGLSQGEVKFDNALILQGIQGRYKSSFFEAIAGSDFFTDDIGNISDKDERIKPHNYWIVEWAELENIFDKSKEANIKAFLTRKTDIIRPPYARSSKKMNRKFSICGTTNKSEFLTDQTGNRRFWVIPLSSKKGEEIDINYAREQRDKLWGAVMSAIALKEPHWLSQELAVLAELEADKFCWRNPDMEDILIPLLYEKVTNGLTKISRQEINDVLEAKEKRQTAYQLDRFMTTYGLAKGAKNISYKRPGELEERKHYRGFHLVDGDNEVPSKLLKAFSEFDLKVDPYQADRQAANLVPSAETLVGNEFRQQAEKTDNIYETSILNDEAEKEAAEGTVSGREEIISEVGDRIVDIVDSREGVEGKNTSKTETETKKVLRSPEAPIDKDFIEKPQQVLGEGSQVPQGNPSLSPPKCCALVLKTIERKSHSKAQHLPKHHQNQ
ncbi:MAG: hypothetical protein F6K17_17550, partial [Okeania sp. SIO3C4]|nr:hypothetical protein [Okeania sp. SIO3C4]